MLTRQQVAQICERLAQQDPARYVTVSPKTMGALENGRRKPRRTIAATLAAALGKTVEELFPLGTDTPVRNPAGKTRIPADRPRGGRPRKNDASP
jgi:DNA-binding XRE family transcriptional regulator